MVVAHVAWASTGLVVGFVLLRVHVITLLTREKVKQL
jgi:hypothetical protein